MRITRTPRGSDPRRAAFAHFPALRVAQSEIRNPSSPAVGGRYERFSFRKCSLIASVAFMNFAS